MPPRGTKKKVEAKESPPPDLEDMDQSETQDSPRESSAENPSDPSLTALLQIMITKLDKLDKLDKLNKLDKLDNLGEEVAYAVIDALDQRDALIQDHDKEEEEENTVHVSPETQGSTSPTGRNQQQNQQQGGSPLFTIAKHPFYANNASKNLGKFIKTLTMISPVTGDDLRSLESFWDALKNVLNAVLNSSCALPSYAEIRQGFDCEWHMLAEPNSALHNSMKSTFHNYALALRMELLGGRLVTEQNLPRL